MDQFEFEIIDNPNSSDPSSEQQPDFKDELRQYHLTKLYKIIKKYHSRGFLNCLKYHPSKTGRSSSRPSSA